MRSLLIGLMMSTAAAADDASDTPTAEVANRPVRFETTVPVRLDYLLSLPKDYDRDEDADQRKWPLVVFLHGAGERGGGLTGDDLESSDLKLVAKHGPPKLVAAGQRFGFILAAPQCPDGKWWQPNEVVALVDHLEQTYRVDPDRIILTGLSMGGYGTWDTAGYAPDRFACAVPVCGGADSLAGWHIGTLPIWAFHGRQDPVVPLAESQHAVEEVNKRGGSAKLTVYDDLQHDSWTRTYNTPAVFEWMLAQRRGQPAIDPAAAAGSDPTTSKAGESE